MKTVNNIFFFVIIFFISVSCTETINTPDDDIGYVPLSDSLVQHIIKEKEDSIIPQKYIYLTIDDAPLNGSIYIDSVISNMKIKTNLFFVGNPVDGSKRFKSYYLMYKENPYIEIYNHSYSHANNRYANFYKYPEKVLMDFEKNQSDFDISHKIARLPGRNLWHIGERKKNIKQSGATSAELLSENGYKVFGWDVEWKYNAKDYTPQQTIDELVNEIEDLYTGAGTFTSDHVVLLMHNQMFDKVNGKNDLGLLIKKLIENNYTFEYLSLYP